MKRLALLTLCLFFLNALSAQEDSGRHTFDDIYLINLSVGHIGVFDNLDNPEQYGLEVRGKKFSRFNLIPTFGYLWTENDSDYYYTELKYDHALNERWVMTSSLGVGLFHQSEEIDLGHSVEFRSGIEFARVFENNYRLGAAFYHLSNSRLSSDNPGTESLVISFSIPMF
ncbi:acyloxyacyl hydrolase [Marinicella sp. W31]|uniref:acyloxyacyl hydrolase n=1 Tax=Marinicella sp. W31 TaxID=3023713 RepID=UPI0037582456